MPRSQSTATGLLVVPAMRDQVLERLRGRILNGELVAGQRLSPSQLAIEFDVSTMPVREALRILTKEGFVESSARRWTRVALPDPAIAEQAYPLIAILEEYGVIHGESPKTATIRRMQEANATMAGSSTDTVHLMQADTRFHDAALEICRNPLLLRQLREMKMMIRLHESTYFRLDHLPQSIAEHTEIIAAYQSNQLPAAGQLIRTNWMRTATATSDPRANRAR